jgi:anti-sigma factor RsiW
VTHPLDQLAPFTDGALAAPERAAVQEHVRSCTRCRAEVAAARGAREAVKAMPAPRAPDLASLFRPERILELAGHPAQRRPRWQRVVPALAAAAVVALVALALPRLGGPSDVAGTAADGVAESAGEAATALRLEIDDTNHDEASLQAAAGAFVTARSAAAAGAVDQGAGDQGAGDQGAGAAATPAAPQQTRFAGPGRTAKAVACLEQAFPEFPGEIVRVQQAAFRGIPAYIGFVLESPGAGTPPDTLSIWVAAVDDCSILTLVSARL